MGHIVEVNVEEGYEPLLNVLIQALDQAQAGKGKERHANGKPFLNQPIVELGRMCGPGGTAQQVMKKTQEALNLPPERGIAELLGAINYAAATICLIAEGVQKK